MPTGNVAVLSVLPSRRFAPAKCGQKNLDAAMLDRKIKTRFDHKLNAYGAHPAGLAS